MGEAETEWARKDVGMEGGKGGRGGTWEEGRGRRKGEGWGGAGCVRQVSAAERLNNRFIDLIGWVGWVCACWVDGWVLG